MAIVLKRFVDISYRNTDERHAEYANCPSQLVESSAPFCKSHVHVSMIFGCTKHHRILASLFQKTDRDTCVNSLLQQLRLIYSCVLTNNLAEINLANMCQSYF